jgi:hypothetical protein
MAGRATVRTVMFRCPDTRVRFADCGSCAVILARWARSAARHLARRVNFASALPARCGSADRTNAARRRRRLRGAKRSPEPGRQVAERPRKPRSPKYSYDAIKVLLQPSRRPAQHPGPASR